GEGGWRGRGWGVRAGGVLRGRELGIGSTRLKPERAAQLPPKHDCANHREERHKIQDLQRAIAAVGRDAEPTFDEIHVLLLDGVMVGRRPSRLRWRESQAPPGLRELRSEPGHSLFVRASFPLIRSACDRSLSTSIFNYDTTIASLARSKPA